MEMSMGEQLVHSTIRITCILGDGRISTGTGFFFNFCDDGSTCVPTIVTNKHVIAGAQRGFLRFSVQGEEGKCIPQQYYDVEVENFEQACIKHPSENVDLCILPIAKIMGETNKIGIKPFYVALSKDLIPSAEQLKSIEPIEDVVMIGYPDGIWDEQNNRPIVRKGITATHPGIKFNGANEFMLDIACFNGSSGSPAFIYNQGSYSTRDGLAIGNRLLFIGIVYAVAQHRVAGEIGFYPMPTVNTRPVPVTDIPNNLALAIQAEALLEFEKMFEKAKRRET
nr:MAG TPA: Trypsin-like peptidase domain [Bacteriophage sp.]